MADTPSHPGDGWGDPISVERKGELETLIARWENSADREDQAPDRDANDPQDPIASPMGPLVGVRLTGADVFWLAARFRAERSTLRLQGANLSLANLEGADLAGAHLQGAILVAARLQGADLQGSHLERAVLTDAHLEGAFLRSAQARGATFANAHLDGADLTRAGLQDALLAGATLDGAILSDAHLERADCTAATFDKGSRLARAHLDGIVLDQVVYENTNLAVVAWGDLHRLGDELHAADAASGPAEGYRAAGRAYRALAAALRNQGLARDTTRFHYRSEVMDRKALFCDGAANLRARHPATAAWAYLRWLVSWALGTFAGYGDYISRLFLTYAGVILAFALAMFLAAHQPLSPGAVRDALVLSLTSFHGRGLQPPNMTITDALAVLAGIEAIFGLLIEGLFIAAFTRRVMGS